MGLIKHTNTHTHTLTHLSQILKAASNQRMRTVFIRHLHRVLDQTQQLHRHLVYVNDPAEDTVHVLMQTSACDHQAAHTAEEPQRWGSAGTYMVGKEHWTGGKRFSEHQNEKVELPQVESSVRHEAPH